MIVQSFVLQCVVFFDLASYFLKLLKLSNHFKINCDNVSAKQSPLRLTTFLSL